VQDAGVEGDAMTDGPANEQTTPADPGRSRWRRRIFGIPLLVLLGIALVVVVAGGAGAWHFSTSPILCNSCHIMKPYVNAWRTSKHKDVPCVQCHYPPGFRDTIWVKYQAVTQVAKWATQTYSSKPFAEVEDASCLRSGCHDRRLLQGKVVFKRGIEFDHRPHLEEPRRGRQLRCTSCHSQIVVGTHIEVTESTCFLCHFKGTKTARELQPIGGCPGCHQPPKGDIKVAGGTFNHADIMKRGIACQSCHLNVVEGEGEAPRERCFTCHNQPEKLKRYDDHPFIHDFHVAGHNIECARCHTEIKHRLPPPLEQRTTSVVPAATPTAAAPRPTGAAAPPPGAPAAASTAKRGEVRR
jgi:nitrate/TMAO reductase-like tetraheme cytochrome c subunit